MAKAEVIRPSFNSPFLSNVESSPEKEQLPRKVAFVFPGQGAQFVGMSDALLEYHAGKEVFGIADTVLPFSLQDVCSYGPAEILNETSVTQPAIITASIATQKIVQEMNPVLQPDLVAGHSLGELSALVAAGAIDAKTAVFISLQRGIFMQEAGREQAGGMGVILGATQEQIQEVLNSQRFKNQVYIANINSATQTVISGEREKVQEALELFKEEKLAKRTLALDVSIAAHTPFMETARHRFRALLETVTFNSPEIPIVLNYTNDVSDDPQEIKESMSEQLTHSVDWVAITQKLNAFGVKTYIEMGPGGVLSGLLRKENLDADKDNILTAKEYITGYLHK